MVVGVGHNHPVAVGDGNVVWMLQLSGLVAHRPEFGHKCAVALEYLDAVVLLVADIDEAEAVGADAPRVVELPVAVALAAEGAEELAAGVEYLDAVVVAVRNDELADSVDGNAESATTIVLSNPTKTKKQLFKYCSVIISYNFKQILF